MVDSYKGSAMWRYLYTIKRRIPMSREKKKVIAAGHICIDITPIFPQEKVERIDDVLKPGRLIEMDNVSVSTGGSVANTGLALKLLGADVSLMGKIGNDDFGKLILNILQKLLTPYPHVSATYSTVSCLS